MDRYTILCTEEQTKKALELGAPIEICDTEVNIANRNIGSMLREDGFLCRTAKLEDYLYGEDGNSLEYNVIVDGTEETGRIVAFAPTAEQMIGWLEDIGIVIMFIPTIKDDKSGYTWVAHVCHSQYEIIWINSENLSNLSHKKVTLDAIDAALDYLIKNKK